MATTGQQEQYDVLWVTTEGNPLLPISPLPNANKSLATNAKQIIKAINEVFKNNQSTQSSVDSFINNFNTFVALIGDTYADSTLLPKLTNISDNIILALDTLNNSVNSLEEAITKKADTSVTNSLGEAIENKTDTSVTNEISEAISEINESIKNLKTSIANGSAGGGAVAQEIINLGSCNLPYSTTSVYQRYALLPIPADVIPKIDFNKPIRVQIFHTCYGGFDALYFDSSKLDFSKLEVGYSNDKKNVGIFNNTGSSFAISRVYLIIE